MFKDFVLFIKYPYTAGVIGTIWIGSAILIGIDDDLPVLAIILTDAIVSYLIAFIGFRSSAQQ